MSEQPAGAPGRKVVPLKANAFEVTRGANTQLLPLFPYDHPGAIVPCCAYFESDGTTQTGYFIHENSVDEVAFTLGSNGRNRTGDIHVGAKRHGVGFSSPVPFYAMMVIAQRQADSGHQPETMGFVCEKCQAPLVMHDYDESAGAVGEIGALPTIFGSYEATVELNGGKLTCKDCGHENTPFPLDVWGWGNYVRQTGIVNNAYAAFKEAGQ